MSTQPGAGELFDLEIDSIGFVDKGDNRTQDGSPGAPILICKRAPRQETTMGDPKETVKKQDPPAGEMPKQVDLVQLLSQLLADKKLTPEEHAALIAAVSGGKAPASEPAPAPTVEEMAKRDPLYRDLVERLNAEKTEKESIRKRLDRADDEREVLVIAKRLGDLPYLPESPEAVAATFHELRKAVRFAGDKEIIAKSAKDAPDAYERMERIVKAMSEAVKTSELFAEAGTRGDTNDGKADPKDESLRPSERLDLVAKELIAKSASGSGKPLGYNEAFEQARKMHPDLSRRYATRGDR